MKFNSQIYLDCYNNLHTPQASKQANNTLLEIYESQDAWKIAEELMVNESHMIHGSQLLSQKLNTSLPPEVNPEILAQFILSVKNISNIHWLCLAKLFVHTHQNVTDLKIQGSLGVDVKLSILKEIPHAMAQMRVEFGVKSSEYKTEVYKQNRDLILESIRYLTENKANSAPQIRKLQDLVFETLQSFTLHNVKLDSEEIANFVLEMSDSDKISNLFEHIFLEEKYPGLDNKVQNFLKVNLKNDEKDWIKTFYLNFYAKKDIFFAQPLQKYTEILKYATLMMVTQDDDEFRSILSDSYQFWLSLITKITIQGNSQLHNEAKQKQALLKESLFVIYESLCKHSKLKKCPVKIKNVESNLDIIDLDNEEGIVESNFGSNANDEFAELNCNVNQIREMSIDLLIKIEEGLKNDTVLYRKIFEVMLKYASDQQSHETLELAIFLVDGMTDCCDQSSTPYLSELIKVILDQKAMQSQYICQRIVILLGKIDKIIISNVSMLSSVFQFFSNSIAYEKLSSLTSQSFTQLMDQYQIQNFVVDQEFKDKSETYLNFWFETFYGKIKNQKVLENITKALVMFIYKFKGPEYYQQFLIMMSQKIQSSTESSFQDVYIEAVATGQNWINARETKADFQYLVFYSNFMNDFLDLMVSNCFKVNRKPDFTKAIAKINWVLKAGGHFMNIDRWLSAIKQIINKALFESQGDVLPVGLTPLITILKSENMTLENLKAFFSCLNEILGPITSLFVSYHQAKSNLDYNFSKYVLQIHNLTVGLLLKHPQISQNNLIQYDPGLIFTFIQEKIFKNKTFWEYEVYKEALIFLNELVFSNYRIETVCFELLGICGRTLESLWIQTENILLSVYKKQGLVPFINSLQKLKPEVLAPNPLFSLLQEGLEKSDRKVLKSFVRCL